MWREIGQGILCLLAVYGLMDLVMRCARRLWIPRALKVGAVVPLCSPAEDLEQTLHRTTEEMLRERGCAFVTFVDVGLDEEEREFAARLAQTEEYSPVISPEKWVEALHFLKE